ncbi:MAG: LCP family protein [Candidatus Moranbacteria bacterium]|nr:LCP family protein [Candidatus Moranbacteria bacterium]
MEKERKFKGDSKGGFAGIVKKRWVKILLIIVAIFVFVGGLVSWRAGSLLNKISSNGNILGTLGHMVPGLNEALEGEEQGRINILLLGMRGADDPAGGNLADSIMVVSVFPKENKASMVSIPRDFYVQDIQQDSKSKINAVYAQGEAKSKGQGLEDMEKKVSEISGLSIKYGIVINHQGFKDLINALGGLEITLDEPFSETVQFNQEGVCDGIVFTVPTGKWQNKIFKHHETNAAGVSVEVKVKKPVYPLCLNKNPECGGNFKLPAGTQTINGDQALCLARSRNQSSDFERAKRQQMIIQKIKAKAFSVGTLTDLGKINGMIDALGNNVSTDLQGWEIKRLYEIEQNLKDPQIFQRVLENSEEGLLYAPEPTKESGYILLPIGDNYEKIQNLFKNILTISKQSDIK